MKTFLTSLLVIIAILGLSSSCSSGFTTEQTFYENKMLRDRATYDSEHNVVMVEKWYETGQLKSRSRYFKPNGVSSSVEHYLDGGFKYTYSMDSDGNQIEKKFNPDGSLKSIREWNVYLEFDHRRSWYNGKLAFEELTEKNVGPYEKHQIKRQWKDGELYSQSVIAKRQSTPNDPIDFPKGEAIKTVELWSPTYSKTTEVLEWY
ncbi:hypothetical protein KC866_00670 [Patescibacteria group bacterium]|nr:hypothetical protein [Patescibacteria group bacterium]